MPDFVQNAPSLPKTRSGKIMRRILRKIAEGAKREQIGDVTTLADPGVVDVLLSVSEENDQLDELDDGMGNIIADCEEMTRAEAEDVKARGELYNTHL